MSWYNYMIKAAEHSKYNSNHWFRYLRKVIFEDGTHIDEETFKKLYESKQLTDYQKVTLMFALDETSPTHEYVVSLNKPAKTPNVDKVREMLGYDK